jgi:hypothetical protein
MTLIAHSWQFLVSVIRGIHASSACDMVMGAPPHFTASDHVSTDLRVEIIGIGSLLKGRFEDFRGFNRIHHNILIP